MFDHILDLHVDQKSGAAYWLDLLKKTGLNRASFHSLEDLHKLGPMDVAGYGNSLFGVTFEREQSADTPSAFFVYDSVLHLHLIPQPETEEEKPRLTETVDVGQRGRVMFHCFDRAFLLINMLGRDTAIRAIVNGQESLSHIEGLSFREKESAGGTLNWRHTFLSI